MKARSSTACESIGLVLVCIRVRDEVDKASWTCCEDDWEGGRNAVNWGSAGSESGLCMGCTCVGSKVKVSGS